MLELMLVPALLGVAFAIDYLPTFSDLMGQEEEADFFENRTGDGTSVFDETNAGLTDQGIAPSLSIFASAAQAVADQGEDPALPVEATEVDHADADMGDPAAADGDEDLCVLATASNTPGMPSVLADFNLDDERLSVVFLDQAPADTTVEFLHDSETDELHTVVDGKNIATVKGLSAEDIPFIETSVAMLPEADPEAA